MDLVVAAIVNEPPTVIRRFVRWYLAQGASLVWLFLDDPASSDRSVFAGEDRVRIQPCTPAFWNGLGLSQDARFTRRQNAALTHAYQALDRDWLLNVDADELMYFPGTTLADRLALVPPDVQTIRVATAELVDTGGDGRVFRLPVSRAAVNEIYGTDADIFRPRFGLVGHADGKSFHRAGRSDLRLRQHWAEDATGAEVTGLRWGPAAGAYLLHYQSPDYDLWRAKLDWRLGSHGFSDPVKERLRAIQAADSDPEPDYRALHKLLHCLTADREARLRELGGLLDLPRGFPKPEA
jgi:hypothetical protein